MLPQSEHPRIFLITLDEAALNPGIVSSAEVLVRGRLSARRQLGSSCFTQASFSFSQTARGSSIDHFISRIVSQDM